MQIKVSVIVPVYNCEKYLPEAIESLLNQSLKECEFIFINDGSTDKSLEILEHYADKDTRIKIISQCNQGVSAARNVGIENAQGEYIGFLDGDDYVANGMYEKLYEVAVDNRCDIVICDFEGGERQPSFEKDCVLDRSYIEQFIHPYLLTNEGFNAVWNKLYRQGFVKKYNITFPKNIALGEDEIFNIKAFTYCERAFYMNYIGYYYRQSEGSATRTVGNKDYFKRALDKYVEELEELRLWNIDEKNIKNLKGIKLLNSVISYTYIYSEPTENRKLSDRYAYVKRMVNNQVLQDVLKNSFYSVYQTKGRYEKFILLMIKKRWIWAIWVATWYSRKRGSVSV